MLRSGFFVSFLDGFKGRGYIRVTFEPSF